MTVRRWPWASTFGAVSSLAAARPARARLGRWPYDDRVAHLVLLDHQMEPSSADVTAWVKQTTEQGARAVRTGALFPNAAPAFVEHGFRVADTLTLLARDLREPITSTHPSRRRGDTVATRLRRLRPAMLDEAAAIDRRSFSTPWANDSTALADILRATPYHRSRAVWSDRRMVGFAISGRADRSGYVQRLAVDPSARRSGIAAVLVDDALQWMQRRNVSNAMVNTAAENLPALALYESFGFERQPVSLVILERALP